MSFCRWWLISLYACIFLCHNFQEKKKLHPKLLCIIFSLHCLWSWASQGRIPWKSRLLWWALPCLLSNPNRTQSQEIKVREAARRGQRWGGDTTQTNQPKPESGLLNASSHRSSCPHTFPDQPLPPEPIIHFTNPLFNSVLRREGKRDRESEAKVSHRLYMKL